MSCSKEDAMPVVINPPEDSTVVTSASYLALGDSYTIGQSVAVTDRYPVQTKNILIADSIIISEPKIIARTGWTTANLQSAIKAENLTGTYDIVTLLIGVNDQYQGMDTAGYRIRFTQLLQQSIAFANNKVNHVIVLSIPDYSVTPFASGSDTAQIRKEIDEFNSINKEITLAYKAQYLYITDLTREAKTNAALLATDRLHPSGIDYGRWANLLAPMIKAVLK